MVIKNRKLLVFCIALLSVVILSFFNKPGADAVVFLTGLYFGANVSQKGVLKTNNIDKEEE